MPERAAIRCDLTGFPYILLAVNLALITRYFYVANRELAEFTAYVNRVGHDRALLVVQSGAGTRTPSYLEHAANYYCLGNGNINLDNYQAELAHFPIRYKAGIARGRGKISDWPNRELLDVILVWDAEPAFSPEIASSLRLLFQKGRLRIFEKTAGDPAETDG